MDYNKEIVNDICLSYTNGESLRSIGKRYEKDKKTIAHFLRKNNTEIRTSYEKNSPIITDDMEKIMCEKYQKGNTVSEIANQFNISGTPIWKILKRHNISIRSSSECNRIYSCNHSFFDNIITEHRAYWLGFLAADGYVKNNHIVLRLKLEDASHLYRFRDSLESNHPIKIYKYSYGSCASIVITSPQLSSGLEKYGVVANKTFTLEWPKLNEDLVVHFIRGYFDGDGGFLISHSKGAKNPRISAAITSTYSILNGIRDCLTAQCDLPQPVIAKAFRGNAHCLRYSSREAVKRIANLFYKDATIYLPRKYERVTQYLVQYPPDGRIFNRRCGHFDK